MTHPRHILTLLLASLLSMPPLLEARESADTVVTALTDSIMINFRQSKWTLDPTLGDNAAALEGIDSRLTSVLHDSVYRMRHVSIIGSASPEGSVAINRTLSERRAASLFGWLDRYNQLSSLDKTFIFTGRDWEGVARLAAADPALPYRDETLALLRSIADTKRASGAEPDGSLAAVRRLRGGVPYRYLYANIFPAVRASKVIIDYDRVLAPDRRPVPPPAAPLPLSLAIPLAGPADSIDYIVPEPSRKPFYMDIRTNMLSDLLITPNIGAEFYIGRGWTVGGTYTHAWWSNRRRHRYWRIYGYELNVRRWFGSAAARKPLTGHHIGIYAQAITYDFQRGGMAHMGGEPGGTILDRAHFGAGIDYGYSLPVARRLNIDFSLGIGYIGGREYEFEPYGDTHLWHSTKKKRWFGPTKVEVSLVWLVGRANENIRKKKGGKR